MRRITLPGSATTTTVLGFGGSTLLGPRSRAQGLALLHAAYDEGVRHFDVARSYGSGDAESVVGEFSRPRRGEVTITTKFGLQPMPNTAGFRAIKGLARRLMRLSPGLRRALGTGARGMVKAGVFGVEEARRNLETSLRELQTDYIDVYLLHDCRPEDCDSPGLFELLQSREAEGRIGRFGVGTSTEGALEITRTRPQFARVVQIENSVLRRNLGRLGPLAEGRLVITHGALGGSFGWLRESLAAHPEAARRWSAQLDANCMDPLVLSGMMLSYAVRANPGGIVLFTSTRPENIRANVRAITEGRFSPEQVDRFAELAMEPSGRSPA